MKKFKISLTALCFVLEFGLAGNANSEGLSILSWNVENFHHVPGYSYRDEIGTWRDAGSINIIESLVNEYKYDVIFFQESSSEIAFKYLIGDGYYILNTSEYDGYKSEFSIADKKNIFPFVAVSEDLIKNVEFIKSYNISANYKMYSRDILYFRLSYEDKKIGFIHVHLKSSCPNTVKFDSKSISCVVIREQFNLIDTIIKEHNEDSNILIVGDFNRELLSEKLKKWTNVYGSWIGSLYKPDRCGLRDSVQPIDFLIAKNTINVNYLNIDYSPIDYYDHKDRISDHCPLSLELEFR